MTAKWKNTFHVIFKRVRSNGKQFRFNFRSSRDPVSSNRKFLTSDRYGIPKSNKHFIAKTISQVTPVWVWKPERQMNTKTLISDLLSSNTMSYQHCRVVWLLTNLVSPSLSFFLFFRVTAWHQQI